MKTGRTPCRVKMVGNLETEFTRIILKQMTEYVTLETRSMGEAIPNQVENYFGAPLHSSFCVNIVFLTTNSKQAFLEAVTRESRNRRLEMLHFIFLESQLFLQQIWQEKPVKRLKFKTGLITNSAGLILTQRETPVADSQQASIQRRLPPSYSNWNSIRNQHLSIVVLNLLPYIVLGTDHKPIMGMTYDFIHTVSKIYNVSRVLDISLTKLGKSRNGSREGFMGDLVTAKKDLLAGIGGIYSRFEALDFSCTGAFTTLSFYASHPKISVKWQAIVFPIDTTVWILIFVFLIALIPLFYIHLKLKRCNDREPSDKMYLAVVIPFSALIESCPKAEVVPQSFEDLSNREDYTIYTIHITGGIIEVVFNETKIETFKNIRERMINQKDFLKCVEYAIFSPKTVCIGWPLAMDSIIAKNLTIHSTFNPLLTTDSSSSFAVILGLQKNSKHFESVNSVVGWASDTGHFTKWRELTLDNLKYTGSQWLKERRSSELYQGLEKLAQEFHHLATKPFGMENVVLCFTTAIVGSCLASLAWLCEIVVSYDYDITKMHTFLKISSKYPIPNLVPDFIYYRP
ncbi:unnamed protein product [Allacma fusca]|uniref:Uncharacterized protein n=1 Tax=Allacma fusca TaxID=39272 RepID=A0A8J2KXT5_9HEXA|nr:unnamed protein product [Allacma fusca]